MFSVETHRNNYHQRTARTSINHDNLFLFGKANVGCHQTYPIEAIFSHHQQAMQGPVQPYQMCRWCFILTFSNHLEGRFALKFLPFYIVINFRFNTGNTGDRSSQGSIERTFSFSHCITSMLISSDSCRTAISVVR